MAYYDKYNNNNYIYKDNYIYDNYKDKNDLYLKPSNNIPVGSNFSDIIADIKRRKREQELLKLLNNNNNSNLSLDKFIGVVATNPDYLITFIEHLINNPLIMQIFFQKLSSDKNSAIKFVILTLAYEKELNNYFNKSSNAYKSFLAHLDTLKQLFANDIGSITQSNISQKQTPMPNITPKSVREVSNLWSPVSSSGVVYKFNRGVIGIDKNGRKIEIIFDRTNRHHNEATAEIGRRTNCIVGRPNGNPFTLGVEVGKQGTIIVQLEGDSMLVYMPEQINQQQYNSLLSEINPRRSFSTVAFTHGDDVYDEPELTVDTLKEFLNNIVSSVRKRA